MSIDQESTIDLQLNNKPIDGGINHIHSQSKDEEMASNDGGSAVAKNMGQINNFNQRNS